jgi:hypothetical protein
VKTRRARFAPSLALALAATLAAAGGCARAPDRRPFQEALRRYDDAVAEVHRTGVTASLERAAGKAEAERVLVLVGGLRARGEVLVARLDALEVVDVKLDPTDEEKAVVLARERWTYERLSTASRAPSTPRTSRDYALQYQLSRRGAAWVVERVAFAEHG